MGGWQGGGGVHTDKPSQGLGCFLEQHTDSCACVRQGNMSSSGQLGREPSSCSGI